MTQTNVLDATQWLVTMHRAIEEYVLTGLNNAVLDNLNVPSGLKIYDVTFDFPSASELDGKIPFRNSNGDPVTLIHFIIDDIENRKLGFGDDIVSEVLLLGEVLPNEAQRHIVNFDVGIWATDASGGSTARLLAYQTLNELFGLVSAQINFQKLTNGIMVESWSGGRMIQDTINDILVYRVIDCTLVVSLFGENTIGASKAVDDGDAGIVIHEEFEIDV